MSNKINATMQIFMAFILLMILSFFAVGFTDSVPTPTNATALSQYNNLSNVTGIAASGFSAVMLILTGAMVMSALLFMYYIVMKKRR